MALSITKVNAALEIEHTPARLDIKTTPALLELRQKQAKVNIDAELPRVIIDQYECFAESGLKNNMDMQKELTQYAERQVLEHIARIAEDGDRLAAIEYGGSPLADFADRDAFPEKEFGMVTMPMSRPRINVEGSLRIDPEESEPGMWNWVKADYVPGRIDADFTPVKFNIRVKQYPSVKIEYLGENIDVRG